MLEEVDLDNTPMMTIPEEDYDDLDEYSFSKFASMDFQGAATPTHIRQRLHQPLLYHEDENDVLVKPPLTLNNFWFIYDVVLMCHINSRCLLLLFSSSPQASLTVWWMILRFMGDLPEPKAQVVSRSGPAFAEGSLQKDVASRQDRRLSHMVGLDQVRKLLFITYFKAEKNQWVRLAGWPAKNQLGHAERPAKTSNTGLLSNKKRREILQSFLGIQHFLKVLMSHYFRE